VVSSQGSATARTTPINVQAGVATNTTVSAQPAYATAQPTYAQPSYATAQPTYAQPTYAQPNYAAPQPVVGTSVGGTVYSPVGATWMPTGYDANDYVYANMALRARQFAAGYVPVTDMYRATMYQGQHERVTVTAAAGRCYRIIGVGGPGVQDLDLRLYDMNGNVIDQDIATDNFPVLGMQRPLCLNWSGSFVIDIHMYSGGGQIGVQAFASN
jgi:hypothetical protein